MMQIAVLGAGSWGTALALQLARQGHEVRLWAHRREHIQALLQDGCNQRYLPDVAFPPNLHPYFDLHEALQGVDGILLAVPSHVFEALLAQIRPLLPASIPIVWAIKGFSHGRLLSECFQEALPTYPFAILAGPSFAKEVALQRPTAVSIAASDERLAQEIAAWFHGRGFLCYTSQDVLGIQVGGAVKNVIAIATGIADGLHYGANTRAALITRGLREISRLNQALGGQEETMMGLAGMGDLILTCTDNQSRNRRFGLALGQGLSASAAKNEIAQVVEGESATHETWHLAQRYGVRMPITEHLHHMLQGRTDLKETIASLLSRSIKTEAL